MKIKHILLLAAIAFQAVSCDKFLDVEPIGKTIPKTYSEFRAVLTDAYNSRPYDRSFSAILSDESKFVPSDDSYIQLYKDTYIWNVISPDSYTQEFPWQTFYKNIFYANHVIKNRDLMTDGKKEEIDQLVGEAYLIRSYMYFNLVNLYSDHFDAKNADQMRGVPISTLESDLSVRLKPSSVAQVYEQIISDLNSGIALLNVPEQAKGYNYRFSKISAYGFAARVYLYKGEFDKAAEFAQKAIAINGKLENLNSSSVMPYNYKSVENILAYEQTFTLDNSSTLVASNSLVSLYNKDNDLRIGAFFRLSSGNYKPKLNGRSENQVSMRTAEFYLIKAEAIARGNGNLTDAKAALKELLKNRLKPDYFTQRSTEIDAMDKSLFVQAVFDERARELAFQGFRWFDLKRNGKPQIVKQFDGQTYTLQQNDPRYVVKFPKSAVINNPNLTD